MTRPAAALLALILAAPLGAAQDAPAPAATKPVPFPVAEAAQGFGATEVHLGMYMKAKNIGKAFVRVAPGEAGGFHVESELAVEFGGMKRVMRERFDVNGALSLTSYRCTQSGQSAGDKVVELRRTAEGKGERVQTRQKADGTPDGEPSTSAVDFPADLLPERVLYLVLGHVPWAEGTAYEIHSEDDGRPVTLTARYVRKESVTHRGGPVEAIRVEAKAATGRKTNVFHLLDGQVVQFAPADAPIRLVRGSAEESAQDLPDTTDPVTAAVNKAAGDFLRGFMTADGALVASALDVPAVQARWAESNPAIAALSPEGLLDLLLKGAKIQLERRGAERAKREVEAIVGILDAKVTGETATVTFPGSAEPIELARKDGTWKVVWWSVFARGN